METRIKNIIIVLLSLAAIIILAYSYQTNQRLLKENELLIEELNYKQYNESELVPCSICGHNVNILKLSNRYYIRCSECGYETQAYEKVQDVIERWNFINNSRQY